MEGLDQIQWDGGIRSAHDVYAFLGVPFEPIWAMQTLVDGQPIFDPMMGSPVLHFTARQGDMWLAPGDWIVKDRDDFKLVHGGKEWLDLAATCETLRTEKPTR